MKTLPWDLSQPTQELDDIYQYYRYCLSRPVICTISFRCFIMQGSQDVKIVPVKCGDGHKYTQEGIIRVPQGFNPCTSSYFKRVRLQYTPATAWDFENAAKQARIKIYFRGFPLETDTNEIGRFFSQFGKLEYLYIMAASKARPNQRSIQGYIIFRSNEHGHGLLDHKESLFFKGLKIFCEIYQTGKQKKSLSETKLKELGVTPSENLASTPGSAPGKISKDRFLKLSDPDRKDSRVHLSFAPSNEDESDLMPKRPVCFKPYLRNLEKVKGNSKNELNVRFNICARRVTRIPNWESQ